MTEDRSTTYNHVKDSAAWQQRYYIVFHKSWLSDFCIYHGHLYCHGPFRTSIDRSTDENMRLAANHGIYAYWKVFWVVGVDI